jgi:hypothetical protein
MLDANSTTDTDSKLVSFIQECNLFDLHDRSPAPSTYIGSASRRIDFILGCESVRWQVTRSGTLSYWEGPQSDHRGLYVDINLTGILQKNSSMALPVNQRSLYTGNPEHVSKYHGSMLKYYSQHNMMQRIAHLFSTHHTKSREEVRTLLMKWDNDQGRAMAISESLLRRPPKQYRWSPDLRNSAILRRYWKLRLREVTDLSLEYTVSFHRWQAKVQQYDPTFVLPYLGQVLSAEKIREHFNRATKVFRRCQRSSVPLRAKCYQELLETYQDDDNPDTCKESKRKARIVQKTIASEVCRGTFREIRKVVNPSERSGIMKIMIPRLPTQEGEDKNTYQLLQQTDPEDLIWETIINKEDIERHLLNYNRHSFRAASESPCGHGVIHDALTFSSLSQASMSILKGDIPHDWGNDDEALKEFLASFAVPDRVANSPPIPFQISEDDLHKGFSHWPESTSTSPSGRHLGHYKAIIQHPDLLRCMVQFLNIAITRGIAIPRWCHATNVLIEKDPGRPRINRLRIIHLFEADFNFFLKLQWGHRLVRKACELDIIHPGQHGSVPTRTAIDPVMLTELTTDLCRVLKHDLARFDNDASACYDRIIVALGMLAARRCGMPENAIQAHAEALEFMKYTLKTVYGVSEDNYHGTPFEPLFGTGQGSGASPAIWLTLVIILLNTLDRLVPDRITFSPLVGGKQHQRLVDAFVDDTSLGFTSDGHQTYDELVERLQNVAQTWEHLLHLSGGKLNLAKCSWYVMYWEWEKGRPRLREITPTDPTIRLQQGSNVSAPTEIRRTRPDESTRMLGVYLNPLGDFGYHIDVLRKKADGYASRLISSRLNANDIRIFHRSIYVPAMRYSLATIAVDEEALAGVQHRIIKVMLQKMHVNGNLPTSIRHGPVEMGGLAIYDLRTEAGIEAIKFFRNSIYSDSEPGNLIRINLQYSQLESGMGVPLLEYPNIPILYLTPTWVLSVRQFLSCHNMSITLTESYLPLPQSPTDDFIMQPTHLTRYSASQQRDINLVRLYLQATTLADLTQHENSSKISLSALDGQRSDDWIHNPLWPRQEAPTLTQRRLWKRYIRSSYLRYVPYWKSPPKPQDLAISVQGSAPPSTSSFESIHDYIRTLPTTHRRLLADLHQDASDVQVWRAFRSKARLYIASDGGLDGNRGTHGWVIASKKHILFRCSGPVDGFVSTESSTRSELAGCASSLLLVASISRIWGLRHRCSFRWITDSRSAISRVKKHALPDCYKSKMPDDVDLISLISTLIREIRRPLRFEWVKGHQDSLKSYEKLPLKARLNIDADFLATRYRTRGRLKSSSSVDHQPGQVASISINGRRLTSKYDSCIRYHINGYHLRRYMQHTHMWSDHTWDDVDFGLFGQHFRRLRPHHQVTHMKRVHGQLPIGNRRYDQSRTKDPTLKLCPCCKTSEETTDHLLRCETNPAHLMSLRQLRRDIVTGDTHPIRYLLVEGIEHWTHSSQKFTPVLSQYPLHLQETIGKALESQDRIGWREAASGFLSRHWSLLASCDMHVPGKLAMSDGAKRMRTCISAIYDHATRIWKARNGVLHSKDDDEQYHIRSKEVAEIKVLYQNPHLLRACDRHLLDRSLDSIIHGSPSLQRRWLRKVRRSIAENELDGGRQSLITQYFVLHTG